ncbi:uncharacterized protein LOC142333816 isoform X2 [Lycorma delicatula]|uniref:uncharacterized protein LOC142333816 isoform X2 n=1 Tax=Lycorma delicatula TaxID=130591 RepID=UPI003F511E65
MSLFTNAKSDDGDDKSLKNNLKELWNSMFNEHIMRPLPEGNTEIQATVMLLETAIFNIKRHGLELQSLQTKNTKMLEELNHTKEECLLLRDEIKRLRSLPCNKCPDLLKKISQQKNEISNTKSRIQSIANILNAGYCTTSSSNQDTQNALTLVSEILVTNNESPTKISPDKLKNYNNNFIKAILISNSSPEKEKNDVIASDTVINYINLSPNKQIIIPETQDITIPVKLNNDKNMKVAHKNNIDVYTTSDDDDDDDPHVFKTPKKNDSDKRKENSPILDRSLKRKKILSFRTHGEMNKTLDNLSQEIAKEISISQKQNVTNKPSSPSPKEESSIIILSPSIIDKAPSIKLSPFKKNICPSEEKNNCKWSLKTARSVEENKVTVIGGKKVKQSVLSLSPVKIKRDITSVSGFNGGMHSSKEIKKITVDGNHSDDDIILSSPVEKNKNLSGIINSNTSNKNEQNTEIKFPIVLLSSLDETFFAPLATSTEKMDVSFDRVPGRKKLEPDYKYQRDAVKKRTERMNLGGWDCDYCAQLLLEDVFLI